MKKSALVWRILNPKPGCPWLPGGPLSTLRSRRIVTKELSFSLWPELEPLLLPRVGKQARQRMKEGLAAGEILGQLLFVNGKAVGYSTFGAGLLGLPCSPAVGEGAEAIPGFFVQRGFEKESRHLITAALERLARASAGAQGPVRLPRAEAAARLSTGTGLSFRSPPRDFGLRLVQP